MDTLFLDMYAYTLTAAPSLSDTRLLQAYDCVKLVSQRTAEECGWTEADGCTVYAFDSDNPDYFTDLIHLSSNGRDALTEILMDCVNEKE